MSEIILPHNWSVREYQRPLWDYLMSGGKRAVCVWHRQAGKDEVALHFTACQAHRRIGNYWHMLPKYDHARTAIWDARNPETGHKRVEEAFPRELIKRANEQKMMLDLVVNSSWQLVGSDNYNRYIGSGPVGIVASEWAVADPLAWAFIKPMLESPGNQGFILFISTPRGNNHLKAIYEFAKITPGWFAQLLTVNDTGLLSKPKLREIKAEYIALHGAETGEALFNQEYYCSFEGVQLGAYYSKQIAAARADKRIGAYPWVPQFEVYTAWDLGVDDSTTIWFFQHINGQYRFIDYYENSGEGIAHYAKELDKRPYKYGDHYMPHDAAYRVQAAEAETREQILNRLGYRSTKIVERPKDTQAVLTGIEAVRNILPQCYFDEVKCSRGLMALESYHAEYDDEKKKMANAPYHDWTSHAADAMRTFVMGYKPKTGKAQSVYEIMGV